MPRKMSSPSQIIRRAKLQNDYHTITIVILNLQTFPPLLKIFASEWHSFSRITSFLVNVYNSIDSFICRVSLVNMYVLICMYKCTMYSL